MLDEYFVSGVVEEAERALVEIDRPEYHHEFVKAVISRYFQLTFLGLTLYIFRFIVIVAKSECKTIELWTCTIGRENWQATCCPSCTPT